MTRSAYSLRPTRVVFGAGTVRELGAELARAGLARALVLSTPGRSADVAAIRGTLGHAWAGAFERVALHVPRVTVSAALGEVARLQPDCCVSIGGGSAIGLGKAIAVERGLPLISIPTTYSGSEMTDTWGVTEEGTKRTGRTPQAAPAIVIYDPELTRSLPPDVSAASGMNGAAHAVEALYAPDANPMSALLAEAALRTFASALPRVVRSPGDGAARTEALRAAHFAGLALTMTTMGLHHKLCHVLGGSFGLPHAPTHAVLLPHVVAFNATAAHDVMQVVAGALRAATAADGLFALNRQLGVPTSLREIGLPAEDVEHAAQLATQSPYPNPRPYAYADVLGILKQAFEGSEPS